MDMSPASSSTARVVHKTCNLCEAMCGLLLEVEAGRVVRTRADPDDPLSRGAICPKAIGLSQIQTDPDRLRGPVRRGPSGFAPISWEEALSETAQRIAQIQSRHGDDAFATYLGNPGAHNFGIIMYLTGLHMALSTRRRFSASSLDQNPKHASSLLLYGNTLRIPVPDIDRTDFLLVLGANPMVSNGSLMSAPGIRKRLRALHSRGGRLVVVDPRRSETAEVADQHLFIRPGADGWLLAALLHVVFEEGLGRSSPFESRMLGRSQLAQALEPFSPEQVATRVGVDAAELRSLARAFAAAPSAVCYGRVGTCLNPFGTLNSWLIDVLNIVTGNFDRPGGAMFPTPAADLADLLRLRGAAGEFETGRTRVRDAPCFNGEEPTACLAEEILTPGPGQIRGLLTLAGNPCISAPNGNELTRALESLDFQVAIDFYVNETTRHADIILPPTWSLEHDNYEVLFHGFAVHNTSKYSPEVIAPESEQRHDWELISELSLRIGEHKATRWPLRSLLRAIRRFALVPSPRRVLGWMLRLGPHGDGFRFWKRGLRLRDLEASPSGVDLGPLVPSFESVTLTEGGRLDLSTPRMLGELARLERELGAPGSEGLVLIGRREVRSNNSWLHNTALSAKGKERCTLRMHPDDARERGLSAGSLVRVKSSAGEVMAPLEVSDELMPGVVCLPHGWGHEGAGIALRLATQRPGVNMNLLTDDAVLEPVVGNAVMNGVPVEVEAAAS
jgi:anaerobic selenocysteine-containing dehydrogenase